MCIYTRRLHIIYSYMLFIIYYRLHIIFDSCYITRAIRYQTVSYQKHYMIEWFFFLTLYHTLFYSILFYLISFHVIITCSKIYHLCVWLWLLSPIFFFPNPDALVRRWNPGGVLAWGNARQGGVAPSSADVARRGQVVSPTIYIFH